MPYFFYRLVPPRPTFPAEITEAEAGAMRAHVGYWSGLLERGSAIVFGPVADPAGSYGIAVVEVEAEAEARRIGDQDPAVAAGLGFRLEMFPMPMAIARPGRGG